MHVPSQMPPFLRVRPASQLDRIPRHPPPRRDTACLTRLPPPTWRPVRALRGRESAGWRGLDAMWQSPEWTKAKQTLLFFIHSLDRHHQHHSKMENPNPRFGAPTVEMEMEMDAAMALTEMAKRETSTESGGRCNKRIKSNGSPDMEVSKPELQRKKELLNRTLNSLPQKPAIPVAEKEAKRILRVLANRESARRTIQRRQSLREELTKMVADLSLDNKNMKMEKELVTKEYLSLKDRNQQLKEQMAKTIKPEVEMSTETSSVQLEKSTSPSTELSLAFSSRPSFTSHVSSSQPIVSRETVGFYDEGNPNRACTMTPLYVPPCALFYPLLHHTSPSDPLSSHPHHDQDVDSIARRHNQRPCSEAVENVKITSIHEGSRSDVPLTATTSVEAASTSINLEEMPSECDTQNNTLERNQDITTSTPSYEVLNPSSFVKAELVVDVKVEKPENSDSLVPEKAQLTHVESHKTSIDPAAAAEARKRRKELKKLKFLHARQIKLNG